ncbi:MAG: hypothetical protein WC974_08415, partial [Thermoplasmata archaeon]
MNEGILKFICAITGHDEVTIKQMFNDWLKSPSSNSDRASEVGVGCVVKPRVYTQDEADKRVEEVIDYMAVK